jgi:hypothetical protein
MILAYTPVAPGYQPQVSVEIPGAIALTPEEIKTLWAAASIATRCANVADAAGMRPAVAFFDDIWRVMWSMREYLPREVCEGESELERARRG